jgi:hypothetical protein
LGSAASGNLSSISLLGGDVCTPPGRGASFGSGFCCIWGVYRLAALADSSLTETVPANVTALGKICGALADWAMAVA